MKIKVIDIRLNLILTAMLFIGFSNLAFSEPLILTDENTGYNLIDHYLVYEDPKSQLKFEEIISLPINEWKQPEKVSPGVTIATFWYKIDVVDQSNKSGWFLVEKYSTIDHFLAWRLDHTTNKLQYYGDFGLLSDTRRSINSRYIVLPLDHDKGKHYTYYLAISSATSIIPLLRIFDTNHLLSDSQFETSALFLWLGCIGALFFYNLFLFCALKDRAYFWYCVYVASFGICGFYITGLHYQYMGRAGTISDLGFDLEHAGTPLTAFIALSMIGMINFCRAFLDTKQLCLRADKILQALLWITILLAIPKIIVRDSVIFFWLLPLQGIIIFGLIGIGLYGVTKGLKSGWYFSLAWMFLSLGMSIYLFNMKGGISEPSFFGLYSAQFSSIIEMILLSLALASKIRELQHEKLALEQKSKRALEESVYKLTALREEADRANIEKAKFIEITSKKVKQLTESLYAPLHLLKESSIIGIENRIIDNATQSMDALIKYFDNLVHYTNLETNKTKVNFEKIEIFSICRSVLAQLKSTARQKNILLSAKGMPENEHVSLYIYSDGMRIRQILNNLISNAIKYTMSGKVTLIVYYIKDGNEYDISIQVRDTGAGIPKEERDNIFNGSYQSDDPYISSQKGLGLGLPLAKKMAKLLNGTIQCTGNKNGCGSIFTFSFSAQHCQEENTETKRSLQSSIDMTTPLSANKSDQSTTQIDNECSYNTNIVKITKHSHI